MDTRTAVKKILEPRLDDIFARGEPSKSLAPEPDELWRRYCGSVLTRQQRITEEFLTTIKGGHEWWWQLASGERERRPTLERLAAALHEMGVRFADDKAQQLLRGWDRDFEGLTSLIHHVRQSFYANGSTGGDWADRRTADVVVARALVAELAGCGVGPKIARLMMIWNGDHEMGTWFHHVVPIDSRWLRALREAGATDLPQTVTRERDYRIVEDELVAACHELGVLPYVADGAVFGWLGYDDEREE